MEIGRQPRRAGWSNSRPIPGWGRPAFFRSSCSGQATPASSGASARLYQAATPYFPFRALLRQALDLEGMDRKETIDKLAVRVQEAAPELVPWLALIGVVLNLEIEPSPEVSNSMISSDRPARSPRSEHC